MTQKNDTRIPIIFSIIGTIPLAIIMFMEFGINDIIGIGVVSGVSFIVLFLLTYAMYGMHCSLMISAEMSLHWKRSRIE